MKTLYPLTNFQVSNNLKRFEANGFIQPGTELSAVSVYLSETTANLQKFNREVA